MFIEFVEDVAKDCGILASTSSNGDSLAYLEELILDYSLMDFGLKADEEALLTDGLLVLWPFDHCLCSRADFTQGLLHFCYISFIERHLSVLFSITHQHSNKNSGLGQSEYIFNVDNLIP